MIVTILILCTNEQPLQFCRLLKHLCHKVPSDQIWLHWIHPVTRDDRTSNRHAFNEMIFCATLSNGSRMQYFWSGEFDYIPDIGDQVAIVLSSILSIRYIYMMLTQKRLGWASVFKEKDFGPISLFRKMQKLPRQWKQLANSFFKKLIFLVYITFQMWAVWHTHGATRQVGCFPAQSHFPSLCHTQPKAAGASKHDIVLVSKGRK